VANCALLASGMDTISPGKCDAVRMRRHYSNDVIRTKTSPLRGFCEQSAIISTIWFNPATPSP